MIAGLLLLRRGLLAITQVSIEEHPLDIQGFPLIEFLIKIARSIDLAALLLVAAAVAVGLGAYRVLRRVHSITRIALVLAAAVIATSFTLSPDLQGAIAVSVGCICIYTAILYVASEAMQRRWPESE